MRGVVTLAAAGGIPFALSSGEPFPGRGVIQAIAFIVAVGTLLIQGSTLPFMIRRLDVADPYRSEEHTSELQSLMRISYAVFCLKKKIISTLHLSLKSCT